jgi:hypothetical protein
MAMKHSMYNENPNPTAEYRAYWRVLNKRMLSVQILGYAITSNLLKAMMLDSEGYLRSRRGVVGLGTIIGELEVRGVEGINPKYLKPRKKLEVTDNNSPNLDE